VSALGDQLKDLLRALRADLVDKHLLPVVLLLAAAAVAIPVAVTVTGSSASAPAPAAPVVASGPGAALAAAPPAHTTTNQQPLGPMHDPFAAPAKAAASTTGTGPTGPTGPGGRTGTAVTVPTAAKSPTGPTGPMGPTQTPVSSPLKTQQTAAAARALEVWSASYSFGQGVNTKLYSNALRLDAVPSNSSPIIQYLGVTTDGKQAAFLVWGPATASGDGHCIDGQTPCQIVELRPGESEFVDAVVPGVGSVQFELGVLSITSKTAATQTEALKAHMAQSADGVKALSQSNATALAKLEYSTVYGVLVPRTTKAAGAHSRRRRGRPSSGLGAHPVRGTRHG
jgi:hypothetical protein